MMYSDWHMLYQDTFYPLLISFTVLGVAAMLMFPFIVSLFLDSKEKARNREHEVYLEKLRQGKQ